MNDRLAAPSALLLLLAAPAIGCADTSQPEVSYDAIAEALFGGLAFAGDDGIQRPVDAGDQKAGLGVGQGAARAGLAPVAHGRDQHTRQGLPGLGAGLVGQLVSSAATLVLLPLVIVPCILAIAVDGRWGILACVGGLGLGAAAFLYGLAVAGRLYDARSGRLLAAVA